MAAAHTWGRRDQLRSWVPTWVSRSTADGNQRSVLRARNAWVLRGNAETQTAGLALCGGLLEPISPGLEAV